MTTSLFELFQRGGPMMWPILVCSIVGLAIAIERWVVLSRLESDPSPFLSEIGRALEKGQLTAALQRCEQHPSPLGRMAKAGLRHYGRPRAQVREAIEEAGGREIPQMQRYIPMLGTIAHIAPLLGLLGTVTGLVRCFQVIQEKTTTIHPVNPGDLAGGIWEALLTTVFGLLVAIPAYAMYNYLVHRINDLVNRLETSASELVDLLSNEPEPTHHAQGSAV